MKLSTVQNIAAMIGIASSILTHNISLKSHISGIYPLSERNIVTKSFSFVTMWVCLILNGIWILINNNGLVSLLIILSSLIFIPIILFSIPKDDYTGLPYGRLSLYYVINLSILSTFFVYLKSYWI